MTSPSLSIGVDGGGTKTGLILCDAAGSILAEHTAPGCNPSHGGPDKARAMLDGALAALLAAAKIENPQPRVSATRLYMAGSPAFWQEYAASLRGYGSVSAATDSLPVLELATDGAPGLVVHAGTGSFIAARATDGSVHYAGGLGWKLGDPGSGFDIGRRGIARALLELQGWAEPTALGPALCAHTGLRDAAANTRFFYAEADANARIAAFAPVVLDQADAGCPHSRAALAASLAELLDQAGLVMARLFPASKTGDSGSELPLGICGSILNRPGVAALLRGNVAHRGWPVGLRFITQPPIEGVRRLLVKGGQA